jgi:hypothetical protein
LALLLLADSGGIKMNFKAANPACWMQKSRKCYICKKYIKKHDKDDITGRTDTLRMFHNDNNRHIAVCIDCIELLPKGYFTCGCGG